MPESIEPDKLNRIEKYPDSYKWQLVESFRRRSDESANYLRALLITISTAAAGYLFNKYSDAKPNWHHLSILLLIVAIGMIVWSWDRQKTKSIQRLLALRDGDYEGYLRLEAKFAATKRNEDLDRISYALIAAAVLVEAVLVVLRGCA
jgi:hypothetical protein